MEIASLLEVGDKGTGLNKKAARDLALTGSIESLPNQVCDELWEEVFEYLEIEYSTVKRRWWASESYDSFRMNITQSHENGSWGWIGEEWVSGIGLHKCQVQFPNSDTLGRILISQEMLTLH
jgi:hypothetical protein